MKVVSEAVAEEDMEVDTGCKEVVVAEDSATDLAT